MVSAQAESVASGRPLHPSAPTTSTGISRIPRRLIVRSISGIQIR
jgi:hypothetical protein